MKVVGKGRQIGELDFVVGEIFLILHVVNVSVLDVLHRKDKDVVPELVVSVTSTTLDG